MTEHDNEQIFALEAAHDVVVAVQSLLKDPRFLELCKKIDAPAAEALDNIDAYSSLSSTLWSLELELHPET